MSANLTVVPGEFGRKLLDFMVTQDAPPEYAIPPEESLVNLGRLDGKQILAEHMARQAKFGTTPFDPAGDRFRLFPGGVTIWSGFPGAGKTTLLRQLVCHILARRSSVFLASLEEDPTDVIVRLAQTAAGTQTPNAHQVQWFIDAYAERFRLWAVIGLAKHARILAVIRQLAEQNIRHAVIDSFMCMDIANDDFEAQRNFANLLAATARAANVHIHLVAHPRKLVSANQDPDINDVAGAREIGAMADNIIFVRRSESAEQKIMLKGVTPMCIAIKKQRHGSGELGTIAGWYHRQLRQYNANQFPEGATRYLPEDAFT